MINIRRFIQDLRPPTLEYLGLLPALRELVNQVQNQSGIKITISSEKTNYNFSPEKGLLTYRIIQEAINNILKHSNATKSEIILKIDGNRLVIKIIDNGKGFKVNPNYLYNRIGLAETYSLLGDDEQAQIASEEVLKLHPAFSVKYHIQAMQYKNKADEERFIGALCKAGLPE